MNKNILVFDCERNGVDFNKTNNKIDLKNILKNKVIYNFKDFKLGHDFYISRDHSTTYDLLKKLNKKVALIIFDQHMDLWNYKIIGNKLNKANFLRKCFIEGYLDYVVFVGIRNGEKSIYDGRFLLNKFDRTFTKRLFDEKALNGFEDKIKLINTKNFSRGLLKAYNFLRKKGFNEIGLDIDLDVFNSNIIRGVEYSKENINNINDENLKKYIGHELDRKGISVKIEFNKLKEKNINLVYKHITEFKPELDVDGKTLKLVKEIINGL